jgi:hypothetical protein
MMTIEEAAKVLKAHNEWRRDATEHPPPTTRNMQRPSDIGIAIDIAVKELTRIVESKDESKPSKTVQKRTVSKKHG